MSDIAGEKPKNAGKRSFELIDPEKLIENLTLKKGSVILDLPAEKELIPYFFQNIKEKLILF
ncbi:MAG: hypothetical protein R6U27_13450 [Desulfobacterales bacterium]